MKRRLNFANGTINHPKLILLDEPTVGVDPQSRNHIFESIRYLVNELKMSVIYTTNIWKKQERYEIESLFVSGHILDINATSSLLTKHGQKQLEIRLEVIDESLLKEISSMENVDFVNYIHGTLYIQSTKLLEITEQMLRLIRVKGLIVSKFNVRESDLEDVFLKLTGKKLRD